MPRARDERPSPHFNAFCIKMEHKHGSNHLIIEESESAEASQVA